MESKSALAPEMVQEFVGNAHGNFERVQDLLAQEAALVNAAWDWGGGDWETALGAAAHMGRKDIARFLLERGARQDIFAAAMLGELPVVKAILSAQPEARTAPGPHGIPLIAHAKKGGEGASEVLAFLEGQSATDPHEVYGLRPVLPVADLPSAVAYYTEKLGFHADFLWGEPPSYAGVGRGPVRIHLSQTAEPFTPCGAYYISVGVDVDGLCAEFKAKGVTIARAPTTEPYRMREFAITDLNGHRVFFGQEVE